MRVDETIAIAALIQAVTAKLWKLFSQNLGFRLYRRMLIVENKQRASRWGLDGKLIDFGKREEVPTRDLMLELRIDRDGFVIHGEERVPWGAVLSITWRSGPTEGLQLGLHRGTGSEHRGLSGASRPHDPPGARALRDQS